jgi:cytidyltransferase-like protein
MDPLGMVHGRFQPFHQEHLEYVLRALERCEHLVIGITNPDPTTYSFERNSDHRHRSEANPYTYFQRLEMIRESLLEAGVSLAKATIVPFHVSDPGKWPFYLPEPARTVQYMRLFSSWEDQKAELFVRHGFRVEALDRRAVKRMSATQVRRLLAEAGDWEALVPKATARVIKRIQAQRP